MGAGLLLTRVHEHVEGGHRRGQVAGLDGADELRAVREVQDLSAGLLGGDVVQGDVAGCAADHRGSLIIQHAHDPRRGWPQ